MTERVSGSGRTYSGAGWSCKAGDAGEGAVECVENAIELHPHLIGERPAGVVIGRRRWTTRIGNVVGMILWLEHVEDVRPEGLRGLDHQGASRITPAVDAEGGRSAFDFDSGLDQRVHELRRRQKIRLVGGNYVPARIPVRRVSHDPSV